MRDLVEIKILKNSDSKYDEYDCENDYIVSIQHLKDGSTVTTKAVKSPVKRSEGPSSRLDARTE